MRLGGDEGRDYSRVPCSAVRLAPSAGQLDSTWPMPPNPGPFLRIIKMSLGVFGTLTERHAT